ncbi:MAG: helix-turn-helix domain-containing protein [Thermoanaerobaculia bacterium]
MKTVEVDAYVIDTLMQDLVGHDHQPSAFLVYLFLWKGTEGGRRVSEPVSLRVLAESTGLSKRAVQEAVNRLERRRLAVVHRDHPLAVPRYEVLRPWRRWQEGDGKEGPG